MNNETQSNMISNSLKPAVAVINYICMCFYAFIHYSHLVACMF